MYNDIRDFGRSTFMHGTWIGPMNHDHVVEELLVRPGNSRFNGNVDADMPVYDLDRPRKTRFYGRLPVKIHGTLGCKLNRLLA